MVTVREFNKPDKSRLIDLMKEFESYLESVDDLQRINYDKKSAELSINRMIHDADTNYGKVFVAEVDNVIVGFIEGHVYEQSEEEQLEVGKRFIGKISELFVSEEFRGQKLGRILLDAMEKYFASIHCDSVSLNVLYPNVLARDVYEKVGYKPRSLDMIKLL